MIHHPRFELIQNFANGEIISPLASLISAHIENCQACYSDYQKIMAQEASALDFESSAFQADELDNALSTVMANIDLMDDIKPQNVTGREQQLKIEVSGEIFFLPSSMNFLKDVEINWKEFGKKNAIAPVVSSDEGNFYLIYIGPGENVPEHGHSQAEYSYVAAGSFKDHIASYETGDFCVTGPALHHSPLATSSDGCLVISWVEGRLNFFKGIFKPLNSIIWWYLHKA